MTKLRHTNAVLIHRRNLMTWNLKKNPFNKWEMIEINSDI